MKNLFITERGAIEMVNNEPAYKNSSRSAIDSVYLIEEDTHIVYNNPYKNKRIELDAEAGDILVKFYDSAFGNPIILVHSKEWEENIRNYEIEEQKRKEEWAAKVASKSESQDIAVQA